MVPDDSDCSSAMLRSNSSARSSGTNEGVDTPSWNVYQTPPKSIRNSNSTSIKKSQLRSTPKTPSSCIRSSFNHLSSSQSLEERLLRQGLMRRMSSCSIIDGPSIPHQTQRIEESPLRQHGSVDRIPLTIRQQHSYKTIYMIRHGESLGQTAKSRTQRCTDPSLRDCALSRRGQEQAKQLRLHFHDSTDEPPVQLVLCSPLTRAIQTAGLAFGGNYKSLNDTFNSFDSKGDPLKIMIHYHLRELGTNIPENQPRSMKQVRRDLVVNGGVDDWVWENQIDTLSLEPPPRGCLSVEKYSKNLQDEDWNSTWPYQNQDHPPDVLRRDYIQYVLHWLAVVRPETCVAVVCHYHVIRTALSGHSSQQSPYKGRGSVTHVVDPQNAEPIKCRLCTLTGQLTLAPP